MREKFVKVFKKVAVFSLAVVLTVNMAYMPASAKEEVQVKTTENKKIKSKTELTYKAYSSKEGWSKEVKSGKKVGAKDENLKAISIDLENPNGKSGVRFKTYVSDKGWTKWKTSGETAGSTKKGKVIKAAKIKLSKALTKKYDIYYRLYTVAEGWTMWSKNGAIVGGTTDGITAESIQIELVEKGEVFQDNKNYPTLLTYKSGVNKGTVRYVSQIENLYQHGWTYTVDGKTYDYTSIADGECALASSCMALSYLGIDISPGEFAYKCGGGALYFNTRWAEWRDDVSVRKTYGSDWQTYFSDYNKDKDYKYSPVIIQLTNYCYSNSHYVVVAGKNSDGTYKVYDCYSYEEWDATIEGGYVYGLGGKANGSIGQVCQYYK